MPFQRVGRWMCHTCSGSHPLELSEGMLRDLRYYEEMHRTQMIEEWCSHCYGFRTGRVSDIRLVFRDPIPYRRTRYYWHSMSLELLRGEYLDTKNYVETELRYLELHRDVMSDRDRTYIQERVLTYQGVLEYAKQELRRRKIDPKSIKAEDDIRSLLRDLYKRVATASLPSMRCFDDSVVMKYTTPIDDALRDEVFNNLNAMRERAGKSSIEEVSWVKGTVKYHGDKRTFRIGAQLTAYNLLTTLRAWETRQLVEYTVHATSDTSQVAYMSMNKGWTSCMSEGGAYPFGPITEAIKGSVCLYFYRPGSYVPCGRELLRADYHDGRPVLVRTGKIYGTGPVIPVAQLTQALGVTVMKKSTRKTLLLGGYDDVNCDAYSPDSTYLKELRHQDWQELAKAWGKEKEYKRVLDALAVHEDTTTDPLDKWYDIQQEKWG